MATELVRTTTELELVSDVECHLPNKRALIAALHKIGTVIGASQSEVTQLVKFFEKRQLDAYTEYAMRPVYPWSLRGRISEQTSLSEWRLPVYAEEERQQLPVWAQGLHFRADRRNGKIVLSRLSCKDVSYANFARVLGMDTEPPARGCSVGMVLPRVHESRSMAFGEGMVVPLEPFMAVLNWFFDEPCVTMKDEERQRHAKERNLALDDSSIEWGQFGVAPYAEWLETTRDLGKYMERRFSADIYSEPIEFTAGAGNEDEYAQPERRHPLLWGDSFSTEMDFVHPTVPNAVDQSTPSISFSDLSECHLDVVPGSWGYWESTDDPRDVALVRLTFNFSAAPPYALTKKQELQSFADGFAAKLKEHFEPAMQALQAPQPEEY